MGEQYDQLSLEERCKIAELHQAGQSLRQIAAALDRSPSSVSRELKRNRGVQVGYKPAYAQEQAAARRWKGSRLERNAELRDLVLDRLSRGWSPEQIAGRLARAKAATRISHESIYRFIYDQIRRTNDGSWRHYLPRAKDKRGRRAAPIDPPTSLIKGRVSIALRPPEVELRRHLRTLGSRSHAVHRLRPGHPGVAGTQIPRPIVGQAARQGRTPDGPAPARLVRGDRPAAAQDHHLRQRHRVRSTPPAWSTSSASKPSSAIPTALGKRAPSRTPSAACDGSSRATPTSPPSTTTPSMPASPPTTTPLENALASRPQPRYFLLNCCTSNVNPHPRFARDDTIFEASVRASIATWNGTITGSCWRAVFMARPASLRHC